MLLSLIEKTVESTAITGKNRAILQELLINNDLEHSIAFLIEMLEKQEVNNDKLITVFVNKICKLNAENESISKSILSNEGL
jgi:hypothetical protein